MTVKNLLTPIKPMITQAFKALRKQNIRALQNFSCCGSCAGYELWDDYRSKKHVSDGYVYYHMQSADCGREIGEVYMGHGSFHSDDIEERVEEKLDKRIATKIFTALFDAGLAIEWNGCTSTTIKVMSKERALQKIEEIKVRQEEQKIKRKEHDDRWKKLIEESKTHNNELDQEVIKTLAHLGDFDRPGSFHDKETRENLEICLNAKTAQEALKIYDKKNAELKAKHKELEKQFKEKKAKEQEASK